MLTRNEFNQALHRLNTALSKGDLTSAFSEIETVLREGSADMKGQCLLLRGEVKDRQGDLAEARQDWMDGLDYAGAGTFLRYCLERNIGRVCHRLGLEEEAMRWYRNAVTTCYRGDEFSGHRALVDLVKLNGGEISANDRDMYGSVIEKSWRVLDLPGTPNLDDLTGSLSKLDDGFRSLAEQIINESDRSAN